MRFVDPSATKIVVIDGTTFVIGFWPPRESELISLEMAAARKLAPEDLRLPSSEEAKAAGEAVYRHMVRYGLRSWKGWDGAPAPKDVLEKEVIRGQECVRVPDVILDVLSLGLGSALYELGAELMAWNNLGEHEAKKSDVPSGSPPQSRGTSAPSANPGNRKT